MKSSQFQEYNYFHFIDLNIEAKRLTDSPKATLSETTGPFPLLQKMPHNDEGRGGIHTVDPTGGRGPPDQSPQELQNPPLIDLRIIKSYFWEPKRTPREHRAQSPVFKEIRWHSDGVLVS